MIEDDDRNDHEIASWTKGEKKRTLNVVRRFEERDIILHAIKRSLQIVTAIMGFLVALKISGIGILWSNLITWMAQK